MAAADTICARGPTVPVMSPQLLSGLRSFRRTPGTRCLQLQQLLSASSGTPRAGNLKQEKGGTHQSAPPCTRLLPTQPQQLPNAWQITAATRGPHRQLDLLGPAGVLERVVGVLVGQHAGTHSSDHNGAAVATNGVLQQARELAVPVRDVGFLALYQEIKGLLSF